jgi:hypothetical protein
MPSLDGIKRRLQEYRPHIQSAYVMYLPVQGTPIENPDESFEVRWVTSSDDPVLPKLVQKWQMKAAKESLDRGVWQCLVGFVDGEPVARLWTTLKSERRYFTGNPRVRLAPDELYFFDLYIEPEHRRGGLAWTLADVMFRTYDPSIADVPYVYSFVEIENSASFMWHHSIGFNIMQSVNMFMFGPRIKWKVPFSDMPRYGPFSKAGRFTDPRDLFGPSIMPNNVPPISDDPDVRLRRK